MQHLISDFGGDMISYSTLINLVVAVVLSGLVFVPTFSAMSIENQSVHRRDTQTAGALKSDLLGTDGHPLSVRVLPPPINKDEVDRQQKEAEEKADADRSMVRLTALLAAIGFLQFIVFLYQKHAFDSQATSLNATVQEMKAATEVSRRQSVTMMQILEQTKKSVEITEIAAKAAELSSRAAINVELPFLKVEEIKNLTPISLGLENFIRNLYPTIKIKNYGRTPAYVDDIIVNTRIGKVMPTEPQYVPNVRVPQHFVVEDGGAKEHVDVTLDTSIYTGEQIASVRPTNDCVVFLFIYGVIKFRDFLGNRYQKGFIFSLLNGSDIFSDVSGVHSAYNYQKQEVN